jgi:hypothetical protein
MTDNSDTGCALTLVVFGGIAAWLFFYDGWHSTLRYSIEYSVSYNKVTKAKKPYDCDWGTAPIGNKNCHYEAQIITVRTNVGTQGQRIVSYDEGKTWVINNTSPPVEPSVTLFWNKVQD